MSRRVSRELCMKLLYQLELTKDFNKEKINSFLDEYSYESTDKEYIMSIVENFIQNNEYIDKLISTHSVGWKLNRIAKVDLSILRLAITEIIYKEDIPLKVSINEAVELAKRYSDSDSASFINGVLGSVVNEIEK
ncbi:NusB antitermination factor [Alkalithermobacter thermoalcaliphilus JW-YL-7 = DSM 7308]|uniref:Transcription antitermination protein NusB n=1 Tax=Alkalithermobacter thermoalcaliphilus JW-YL-7 = DSM 7308 TaxID=1121328 RepID=A0A150FRH5_CLOPD|nr:NusB antitermination factor [[Clostridium] paradoxum JW-YL-7 = DSM 7308]SHK66318.1 NusB antitermination factor [[Clostridium] paradoxum JW-YL-7 = DSM 7308]